MKYDFELDLVNNNSLSWIIEQLKSNTTVLEFGPANGRLTKYMKEQLNCKVYLAEIDEEAGKEALQYGEDLVVGDVENYEWLERYQDIRFDFMVFADVLEHLRNPEEVLVRAKHLLKPEGTILLSVPNLAHNSVLINLLNNRFEYTQVGLLDNTHIHMFTKESLENMLLRAGLCVEKRIGTYCPVGSNEIANTIDDIPEIDRSYWLSRDYGEVYQFVYAVKKGMEYIEREENNLSKQNKNYYAQLFVGTEGCSENNSVKIYIENMNQSQNFVFHNVQHGAELRFDPLNTPCMMAIESVVARTVTGDRELSISGTNAKVVKRHMFTFITDDPIIQFNTDFEETIERLEISVRYIFLNEKKIKEICECQDEQSGRNEKKLQGAIEERDDKIVQLRGKVLQLQEKLQNEMTQAQNEMTQAQNEITRQKNEILQLQNAYQQKDVVLDQILHSKRWKLASLFKLRR